MTREDVSGGGAGQAGDGDQAAGAHRAAGHHRVARRLVAALTAVLAGVLGALVLYYTSLQPGAAVVRALFERGALVTPPRDFRQVARAVTGQRVPIAVPGAPPAHLDIYTPVSGAGETHGQGSKPRPVILWVHGGGFISSSAATVRDYAILLAHAGYTVASLDYSLAPGARYPVPGAAGQRRAAVPARERRAVRR